MRKSVDETWRHLEAKGDTMPRDPDGRPFVPAAMPSYDDEDLGFSFFRSGSEGTDLRNLSLPRTYFGRSLLQGVSFANTDLSESRMCWNDFEGCDFSGADLSRCDMRASNYKGCSFVGAVLREADLRRSSFEDCDFTGAELAGTVAEDADLQGCVQDYLTDEQRGVMAWSEDEGPEPAGG